MRDWLTTWKYSDNATLRPGMGKREHYSEYLFSGSIPVSKNVNSNFKKSWAKTIVLSAVCENLRKRKHCFWTIDATTVSQEQHSTRNSWVQFPVALNIIKIGIAENSHIRMPFSVFTTYSVKSWISWTRTFDPFPNYSHPPIAAHAFDRIQNTCCLYKSLYFRIFRVSNSLTELYDFFLRYRICSIFFFLSLSEPIFSWNTFHTTYISFVTILMKHKIQK